MQWQRFTQNDNRLLEKFPHRVNFSHHYFTVPPWDFSIDLVFKLINIQLEIYPGHQWVNTMLHLIKILHKGLKLLYFTLDDLKFLALLFVLLLNHSTEFHTVYMLILSILQGNFNFMLAFLKLVSESFQWVFRSFFANHFIVSRNNRDLLLHFWLSHLDFT